MQRSSVPLPLSSFLHVLQKLNFYWFKLLSEWKQTEILIKAKDTTFHNYTREVGKGHLAVSSKKTTGLIVPAEDPIHSCKDRAVPLLQNLPKDQEQTLADYLTLCAWNEALNKECHSTRHWSNRLPYNGPAHSMSTPATLIPLLPAQDTCIQLQQMAISTTVPSPTSLAKSCVLWRKRRTYITSRHYAI